MKFKFTIIFLIISCLGHCQNLAPNGNFENYLQCPTNNGYLGVSNWSRVINHPGTADYLNSCASLIFFSIPTNICGFQEPLSGNGYFGMFQYIVDSNIDTDSREYISAQLTSPLVAGKNYHVSFFVSLAESCHYGVNNIGAAFTNSPITGNNTLTHLNVVPQINSTSVILEKNNWVEISGSFLANGGENFITIGNFYSDVQTSIEADNSGSGFYSYYYLDNVTVEETNLAIEEHNNDLIYIYPNPFSNYLNFEVNLNPIKKLNIYNSNGLIKEVFGNTKKIDLTDLPQGLYLIVITTESNLTIFKKVIKSNK